MDACNIDFAREMVEAFGQDRFYHAVMRSLSRHVALLPGSSRQREARQIFLALGGSKQDWGSKCLELKLNLHFSDHSRDYKEKEMDADEARLALCRTAFMIAKNHKEYARKKPEMPPSIHARMILDSQNEWTQKYAKALKEFES